MAVSKYIRDNIIRLHKRKHPARWIARELGMQSSTVSRIITRFHKTGSTNPALQTGRPRALTAREERYIVRKVLNSPLVSAFAVAREVSMEYGKRVTVDMVRRTLYRNGIHGRRPAMKPKMTKAHIKERLRFAEEHANHGSAFWDRVIFSDEALFHFQPTPSGVWDWRKVNERYESKNLVRTVRKGGGSLMIWGCITANGVGWICSLPEGLDSDTYVTVLEEELEKTIGLRFGQRRRAAVIFQHDGAGPHRDGKVREYLGRQKFQVLGWPAISPDLSPIENLWADLKRRVTERGEVVKTKEALFRLIEEEWEATPVSYIKSLYASLPRRIKAVKNAKGGPTRY
jgi:transposase